MASQLCYDVVYWWTEDEKPSNVFTKTFQAKSIEEAKSEAESYRALLEEKHRTKPRQKLLLKSVK